jgi:indole-3-glycerol phosphate synthase
MIASSESSVLTKIATRTQERVALEKSRLPIKDLLARIPNVPEPQPVLPLFSAPGVHIIAEVKRASPSSGVIAANADPVEVAADYLRSGARMVSVLTEPEFFDGNLSFLLAIRRKFPDSYLLMKDFIIDEYQVAQGRLRGADAILLIAALLDDQRLRRLYGFARALGLTPLVEVHNEPELQRALELGADLIGVNNRDLNTLEVSLDVSQRLASCVPAGKTLIAESGIQSGDDLRRLARLGYRGFLVGTSLMKTGRPGTALKQLLRGAE